VGIRNANKFSKHNWIFTLSCFRISRSLKRICEALRTNVTIEVLDLSRNDLTDAPLKFLAPVLSDQQGETLHGLRELYLSRNYIQDEGLLYLNKGFADNSTLEVLDLGFNRLLGEAGKNLLGIPWVSASLSGGWVSDFRISDSLPFYLAAAQHKSLRRLDLQWNSIQDTAGSAIAKIMVGKKSKLEYLNVSSNLLTAATCAEFGKCFAGSKTTTTLIAGPNKWNVGPLTQGYLANMMAPLLKAKAPAAELLDLCYITPVHSQFIKVTKSNNSGLNGITITRNPILRRLVSIRQERLCWESVLICKWFMGNPLDSMREPDRTWRP